MGTDLSDDMNGTVSEYPGEDPTELEHKKAMEYLERALRSKDLLSYAVASPASRACACQQHACPACMIVCPERGRSS